MKFSQQFLDAIDIIIQIVSYVGMALLGYIIFSLIKRKNPFEK